MKNFIETLRASEDGYVFILVLLFMPVFLGVALLVIDVGRANNSHSDLQAAADAVAIAGAIELDGEPGAIANAKAAMAQATNTVSMLNASGSDLHIDLTYADAAGNEFSVIFLEDIPPSDDTPIDATWVSNYATVDDAAAQYVYVAVQSSDFRSIFPKPSSLRQETVSLGARAVATNPGPVACDVAPVFICNPFQNEGADYGVLSAAMDAGRMHGRLITLIGQPRQGTRAGPGNWGYLRTGPGNGGGANVLRDAMGGYNPECYSGNTVDTKPGRTASVIQGFNTRFGQYAGPMNRRRAEFPPDVNIREFVDRSGARIDNEVMAAPGSASAVPGAWLATNSAWNLRGECRNRSNDNIEFRGTLKSDGTSQSVNFRNRTCRYGTPSTTGDWEPGYWEVAHDTPWDEYLNTAGLSNLDVRTTYTNEVGVLDADTLPSRQDIYAFELEQGIGLDPSGSMPDGVEKRREMFVAVLNCDGLDIRGDTDDLPVLTFATVFLPNKMPGPQETLSIELIDLKGFGGSTSLDEIWREESVLVR